MKAAEQLNPQKKIVKFNAPADKYKYDKKFNIKKYDCENIIGVGIKFKNTPANDACGAIVLGDYAASVSFSGADIADRYFEFRFNQNSCWNTPDSLRIFDYNSYCSLGEIEEIVFIYKINPNVEGLPDNSVKLTSDNNTFDISEYRSIGNIESITINFADYTYGGNGALVFGNWESSYSFNMSRENGKSITIDVENIADTFTIYNWYNLSSITSIELNFE